MILWPSGVLIMSRWYFWKSEKGRIQSQQASDHRWDERLSALAVSSSSLRLSFAKSCNLLVLRCRLIVQYAVPKSDSSCQNVQSTTTVRYSCAVCSMQCTQLWCIATHCHFTSSVFSWLWEYFLGVISVCSSSMWTWHNVQCHSMKCGFKLTNLPASTFNFNACFRCQQLKYIEYEAQCFEMKCSTFQFLWHASCCELAPDKNCLRPADSAFQRNYFKIRLPKMCVWRLQTRGWRPDNPFQIYRNL